jgi:Putative restriction endonuclease
MIVVGEPDRYRDRHPGPGEVSCVLEVAESSLLRDRTVKLRLYAQAAIPQYVLVNLVDERLEIHEEPVAGEYRLSRVLGVADDVSLLLPDGSRLVVPAAAWLA